MGTHRWDTECCFFMTSDDDLFLFWNYFRAFFFIIDPSFVIVSKHLCTIDSFMISYCCLCTPTTLLLPF